MPVKPPNIHRCRVPTDLLLQLLCYIESPANAERCAFGTKVLSLAEGDVATIDNVSLRMKLDTFVIAFLMETFIEFDSIVGDSEDLSSTQNRCDKKKRKRASLYENKQTHKKVQVYTKRVD